MERNTLARIYLTNNFPNNHMIVYHNVAVLSETLLSYGLLPKFTE